MNLKIFLRLIKLGATPPSIIYPYPFIPFLAFAISKGNIIDFLISLAFVSTYFSAVNLWNHINDVEEDVKAGRKEFKILLEIRFKAIVFVLMLYLIAFLIVILKTNSIIAVILYIIISFITWLYSDKIFIGRFIKRFKEHYVTEVLTYIVVVPLFSIVLWCFFSNIDLKCLEFTAITTVLSLSIVVLKDIKDISADLSAGYKTLAVVFSPQTLLKVSFALNFLYYILILVLSVFSVRMIIIGLIPFPVFLYLLLNLSKRDWMIDKYSANLIKAYVYSYLASIALVCIGAFYENFIKDIALVVFMHIPLSTSVIKLFDSLCDVYEGDNTIIPK